MRLIKLGLDPSLITKHAELLATGPEMPLAAVKAAWKGIQNYPLLEAQKIYLRNQLFSNFQSSYLWNLDRPFVLVYRWPNQELRYFLISDSGHLLESDAAARFYQYFSFLCRKDGEWWIDIEKIPSFELDSSLIWLPQSSNYSHFLCDFLGPWVPFASRIATDLSDYRVLTFDPWKYWQKDFLQYFGFAYKVLAGPLPGEILLIRPNSVAIPILSHTMHSQACLRQWIHETLQPKISYIESNQKPLLMTRNGVRQARIRNINQLASLVRSYDGIAIDPSTLNNREKLCLLKKYKILIGDGSASMNHILFASTSSIFISLSDKESILNHNYLDGGWPYMHLIANRTRFVVGIEPKPLPGSPLGSSIYPTDRLATLLEEVLQPAL